MSVRDNIEREVAAQVARERARGITFAPDSATQVAARMAARARACVIVGHDFGSGSECSCCGEVRCGG